MLTPHHVGFSSIPQPLKWRHYIPSKYWVTVPQLHRSHDRRLKSSATLLWNPFFLCTIFNLKLYELPQQDNRNIWQWNTYSGSHFTYCPLLSTPQCPFIEPFELNWSKHCLSPAMPPVRIIQNYQRRLHQSVSKQD